jgi:hypothetical protein
MVKKTGCPGHRPFAPLVEPIVIVAVIGLVPELVAVKAGIKVVPFPPKPIEVLELLQV